jgi:hypothetical protein
LSYPYGQQVYGTDPYGGELVGLTIANAFASAIRVVRVTLSREPLHYLSTGVGDALNPATWTVQNLTTLAYSTVISVAATSPPLTYDIAVLEKFSDQSFTYQLAAPTLVAPTMEPITFAGSTFNFPGLKYTEDSVDKMVANRRASIRDLANPPATLPNGGVGGTLLIKGGDYSTVQGADLVKKLVLRRLVTRPGEFTHLPSYGVGLNVKAPLPTTDITRLQKIILAQVQKEPEIDVADVAVTLNAAYDIVIVTIRARLKATGQDVNMQFRPSNDALVAV